MNFGFLYLYFYLGLFGLVIGASNYEPEDYEIFSLNDKVRKDLGQDITFYSWLGLEDGPKATIQEISKAYRKLSRQIHPDKFSKKARAVRKEAEERFQRLSLVGNILRDQSLRKRYDYYYSKGFPKWRDNGYFYSKFRPGIILTIFLLYLLVSVFHYASMRISRNQDYKRLRTLKGEIKRTAWGDSLIPPTDGSERKVSNGTSNKEFLVRPDGSVYLIFKDPKENDELILLDESQINLYPSIWESLLLKIPVGLWNYTVGKICPSLVLNTKTEPLVEGNKGQKVKKKNHIKGKRIELPNGKVIYGRNRRK